MERAKGPWPRLVPRAERGELAQTEVIEEVPHRGVRFGLLDHLVGSCDPHRFTAQVGSTAAHVNSMPKFTELRVFGS